MVPLHPTEPGTDEPAEPEEATEIGQAVGGEVDPAGVADGDPDGDDDPESAGDTVTAGDPDGAVDAGDDSATEPAADRSPGIPGEGVERSD